MNLVGYRCSLSGVAVRLATLCLFAFLAFFSFSSIACAQPERVNIWIGFSAGYGSLAMQGVNDELGAQYRSLSSSYQPVAEPKEVNGGVFYEGSAVYRKNALRLGITVSHFRDEGSVEYKDANERLYSTLNVSATEFVLTGAVSFPWFWKVSYYAQGGLGYATANCDYERGRASHVTPDEDYKTTHEGSAGYVVARAQTGLELNYSKIGFHLSASYRYANAGTMKGTYTDELQTSANRTIQASTGEDIHFDFSGATVSAGISVKF